MARGGFTSYVGFGAITLILMYIVFLYNATKTGLNTCEVKEAKLKDEKTELLNHLSVAQEYNKRVKQSASEVKENLDKCNAGRREAEQAKDACLRESADTKVELKNRKSELSGMQQEANELRERLRVETEDCAQVKDKSMQEFQKLQSEKQSIETNLQDELAKKRAEVANLEGQLATLRQQQANQQQANQQQANQQLANQQQANQQQANQQLANQQQANQQQAAFNGAQVNLQGQKQGGGVNMPVNHQAAPGNVNMNNPGPAANVRANEPQMVKRDTFGVLPVGQPTNVNGVQRPAVRQPLNNGGIQPQANKDGHVHPLTKSDLLAKILQNPVNEKKEGEAVRGAVGGVGAQNGDVGNPADEVQRDEKNGVQRPDHPLGLIPQLAHSDEDADKDGDIKNEADDSQ